MSGIAIGPDTELHPDYGPCDGFGPGGQCAECAKAHFTTEHDWLLWLRSDHVEDILQKAITHLTEVRDIAQAQYSTMCREAKDLRGKLIATRAALDAIEAALNTEEGQGNG